MKIHFFKTAQVRLEFIYCHLPKSRVTSRDYNQIPLADAFLAISLDNGVYNAGTNRR